MLFNAPKKLIAGGAILAASGLILAGCAGDNGEAQSTEVNVALPNHTWTNAIKERLDDFKELTGIKVNLVTFGEDQLSDQYNVKLNARTTDFDVMMYRPLQEGKMFTGNGWLSDITEQANAATDWNWSDFQEGPRDAVTGEDGKTYGVPLVTEREILYSNKEILDAKGIAVPTTMEELRAAVAAVHDPANDIYGFVSRGARSAGVTQFSSFLYSFGGTWDANGKASIDTPEALAAYEYYSSLLREFGPDGTTGMSWPEALAVMAQGKAVFYTDADSLYNNFNDPSTSSVIGKIGFAQFPAGPAGSKPYNVPSWALAINEFSTNKDNAWKFLEWATSPEMSLDIQSSGVPLARTSVWENPQGTSGFPADLVEVINTSAEVGVGYDRPLVIAVGEARDIVGTPIVEGIEGRDVAAAVKAAQTAYQAFLDNEK